MRRILKALSAIIIISGIIYLVAGICMAKENLYDMFSHKAVVKVFITDITDSTKENKADVIDLKKQLETAFSERKSMHFEVVKDIKDADIAIAGDVTKYYWSATDPLDMLLGTGPIIMDAVTSDNYAYMEAFFTVTDVKKNRVLWKDKLRIDLTKNKMTEKESVPLINHKTSRILLRDAFSKNHSRRP